MFDFLTKYTGQSILDFMCAMVISKVLIFGLLIDLPPEVFEGGGSIMLMFVFDSLIILPLWMLFGLFPLKEKHPDNPTK